MRVLLAVADNDESVRIATVTHELLGDGATYLVMSVGEQELPMLGSDPMAWGVPYPLVAGGSAAALPLHRPANEEGPGAARPESNPVDLAREGAQHVAGAAGLPIASTDTIGEVGDVAECIRSVAESESVDLIVVGRGERGWLRRLLAPSVSSAVVREQDRPVLVVP